MPSKKSAGMVTPPGKGEPHRAARAPSGYGGGHSQPLREESDNHEPYVIIHTQHPRSTGRSMPSTFRRSRGRRAGSTQELALQPKRRSTRSTATSTGAPRTHDNQTHSPHAPRSMTRPRCRMGIGPSTTPTCTTFSPSIRPGSWTGSTTWSTTAGSTSPTSSRCSPRRSVLRIENFLRRRGISYVIAGEETPSIRLSRWRVAELHLRDGAGDDRWRWGAELVVPDRGPRR